MKHEKVSSVPPEDLPATPATGLTEEEAARRAEMGLDNRHKADAGKSVGQILAGNFFSLFNMLNFALAACLILVGSYRNMLFLGVVFSNTLIGTVQELRAKRTLQRLKLLNAPAARVLREGQEKTCLHGAAGAGRSGGGPGGGSDPGRWPGGGRAGRGQ